MDETLLQRLDRLVETRSFRSRIQVVQEVVSEKINRIQRLIEKHREELLREWNEYFAG